MTDNELESRRGPGCSSFAPYSLYCREGEFSETELPIFEILANGFPTETVRKGCKGRSWRGFGRYTEAKMGQEAPFRWPVRLRFRRIRDFSDSFTKRILGNWASGVRGFRREAYRPRAASNASFASTVVSRFGPLAPHTRHSCSQPPPGTLIVIAGV